MLPLLVLGALLLSSCHGDPAARPAPTGTAATAPVALGGPSRPPVAPPQRPMDDLERPVHARLAAQLAGQGLTLDYLACPRWRGRVPVRLTCKGYVDGLVAPVAVHLRAAVAGKAVGFDARLLDGVISTRRLERTLARQGGREADCGRTPAYPAEVGLRVVCRVTRAGGRRYVVATVTDRSGAVMISDYRPRS